MTTHRRTKKQRIKMLEDNIKEGKKRYDRGEVDWETWQIMKKDAQRAIREIKTGERS